MERRPAAILAADVVGYSRLMGEDETGTLARLTRLRKERIEPLIAAHNGRVFKLMGDGILVEFVSGVDAVGCAVAWQTGAADVDLCFRIGINSGDVIAEDGDVYGNCVNIAARLEALADPGGICLSGKVQDEVRGKLDLALHDMGTQAVKNIAKPLRSMGSYLRAQRRWRLPNRRPRNLGNPPSPCSPSITYRVTPLRTGSLTE